MDTDNICTICDKALEKESDIVCTVHEKGLKSFIVKSQQREDNKWELWTGKPSAVFHQACRKRYSACSNKPAKKARLAISDLALASSSSVNKPELSSTASTGNSNFNFTELCFICGKLLDRSHKKVHTLTEKRTLDRMIYHASLASDSDSGVIYNRLIDLSSDSSFENNKPSYHTKCYFSFTKASLQGSKDQVNLEKKTDQVAFEEICDYIEKSGKFQFPLHELKNVVEKTPISQYILFKKLKEKYDNDILIAQHVGRSPVVYYKTSYIGQNCNEWLRGNKVLSDIEKNIILYVAAKILHTDIQKVTSETEIYPPVSEFLDNVGRDVPESLNFFLGELLTKDTQEKSKENITGHCVKRDSIAHSIISMLRPKSFISNLQLAVGTYIYRKTGSKLTINILSKLGVCASYYNIQLYEASAITDPIKANLENVFNLYFGSMNIALPEKKNS